MKVEKVRKVISVEFQSGVHRRAYRESLFPSCTPVFPFYFVCFLLSFIYFIIPCSSSSCFFTSFLLSMFHFILFPFFLYLCHVFFLSLLLPFPFIFFLFVVVLSYISCFLLLRQTLFLFVILSLRFLSPFFPSVRPSMFFSGSIFLSSFSVSPPGARG